MNEINAEEGREQERIVRSSEEYYRARALARRRRWSYPGKARVEDPAHGSVIVPHGSNLSALLNAAEYWGCDVDEIIRTARVWACDRALPVVRPREFCKNTEGRK